MDTTRDPAHAPERIQATIDLAASWTAVATSRRGRTLLHYYHYRDTGGGICLLICEGLHAKQVVGQVAEISIEQDVAGPVVTVHGLSAAPRAPGLRRLLWPTPRPARGRGRGGRR